MRARCTNPHGPICSARGDEHGQHRQARRWASASPLSRRTRQGARTPFNRKIDAQNWLDSVTTAMQTGVYVDPIAARSQSGIGLRVGLTVRRIQSRPRTSAMPASCASTFSRSGPLCNSSTSRTPTCRRGSRGWRRGARRRRCARFIACFHSSSRRPSGTVDWRGIRQRRSTCRGSSPPSADISRTSRCMHWPRRWRNPAEVSKHRRLDERENRADRLIVLFLAYTGVRFGEPAVLRGAGWISCGAGPSSPSP